MTFVIISVGYYRPKRGFSDSSLYCCDSCCHECFRSWSRMLYGPFFNGCCIKCFGVWALWTFDRPDNSIVPFICYPMYDVHVIRGVAQWMIERKSKLSFAKKLTIRIDGCRSFAWIQAVLQCLDISVFVDKSYASFSNILFLAGMFSQ